VESTALDLLLNETEIADMDRLETTIQRGLDTFMEVGSALAEINERKLYRQTHATFADYCRQRWNMHRSRAYQLMNASKTAERIVSTNVDIPKPESEGQIRPLSQLAPERQAEAWQRAVATAPDGEVTGEHVQAVVDEMLGRSGRFDNDLSYAVDGRTRRIFNAPAKAIYGDKRFVGCDSVVGRVLNNERKYDAYSLVDVPETHPKDLATALPLLTDSDTREGRAPWSMYWPVDRTRHIIFDAPFES